MGDVRWPNAGRRITAEPAVVTHSPPFDTTYPRLINDDLIDPASRAAMEVSWKKSFFEERDLEIFSVRGVYEALGFLLITKLKQAQKLPLVLQTQTRQRLTQLLLHQV
jgi:hypothetical protein